MFSALSRLGFAAVLSACVLVSLFASVGSAQTTIDLSLNVFYTNPGNILSGGTWDLVAKSSNPGTFGIAGLTALISNIKNDVALQAPSGTSSGGDPAGFQVIGDVPHPVQETPPQPAYRSVTVAEIPIFPIQPGHEATYFYGVGTLTNGSPNYAGKPVGSNSIGPTFASLTGTQDIPWATGDEFGDSTWSTAARMLSGTFDAGVTPGFISGSSGNVFTFVPGANNTYGNDVLASSVTTIVRTNFTAVQSADYNHNGIVDAGDYVIWRKTLGNTATPPGSGADGNGDGTVNMADYTLWRSHFGNPFGAGAGASLSTTGVPEPASCVLLTIAGLLSIAPRRARKHRQVNN